MTIPPQPDSPQFNFAPASARKPVAVILIQVAVFVVALSTPALILLMLQRLVGLIAARSNWAAIGLDAGESEATPMDLARTEFLTEFTVVLSLPVLLTILATISAIGLHRRRRWARILTAIWSGIFLLPMAAWAVGCSILWATVETPTGVKDYFIGPIDPITLNAVAGIAAFVCILLVFILIFTRGVRQWAPKRSTAGPNALGPPGPAPGNGQWGYAPQPVQMQTQSYPPRY